MRARRRLDVPAETTGRGADRELMIALPDTPRPPDGLQVNSGFASTLPASDPRILPTF
jgi:hypothetical protein